MNVLGRVFGHPIWNFIAMFLALLTYFGIKVDKITEYLSKHLDVRGVTEYSLLLTAIFFAARAVYSYKKRNQPATSIAEAVSPTLKDLHQSLLRFVHNPEMVQISIPGKTGYFPRYKPHFMVNLGWEWKETIKALSGILGEDILYYRFGEKYHLIDLATGEIVKIPSDVKKGLMLKDTGIREGMVLELREVKKL
jgi:hypothetical protein